jgi:hypothetical protein
MGTRGEIMGKPEMKNAKSLGKSRFSVGNYGSQIISQLFFPLVSAGSIGSFVSLCRFPF